MAFHALSSAIRNRKQNANQPSYSHSPEDLSQNADQRQQRSTTLRRVSYSLLYLAALIFIILIEIGSTSDKPVLRDTYFLKIDLSDIIPHSVPDAVLINSIARTIGLHDFYQVGLWNFCEGFGEGEGITFCSKPKKMYAFNPVEIIMNELLAGATIALPGEINDALNIARIASHWMFGLFLVGGILTFLCIFLAPLSVAPPPTEANHHRRRPHNVKKRYFLPVSLLAFLAFFTTTAACVVATAMFTIFKGVFSNNEADLNIHAELGTHMLAFMWTAVGLLTIGFILQMRKLCWCCCCCCYPRRRKQLKNWRREEKEKGQSGGESTDGRDTNGLAGNGFDVDGRGQNGEKNTSRHRAHGWRRMRLGG